MILNLCFFSNFDSFLHNETLKNEKISVSPLHHGFSFRNKISNNIDHYELENLIANYQETSTSLTPIPVNKTIGYPKGRNFKKNHLILYVSNRFPKIHE